MFYNISIRTGLKCQMKGTMKMHSKLSIAVAIITAAAAFSGAGCAGNSENKTESAASSMTSAVSASSISSASSTQSDSKSQSSAASSQFTGFIRITEESSKDESSDDFEEVILKVEDAVGTWTCSDSRFFKTIELKSNGDAKLTLKDDATIDTYFRIRGSKLYINIMQFDDPFTLEDGKLIYDDEGDVFTRTNN